MEWQNKKHSFKYNSGLYTNILSDIWTTHIYASPQLNAFDYRFQNLIWTKWNKKEKKTYFYSCALQSFTAIAMNCIPLSNISNSFHLWFCVWFFFFHLLFIVMRWHGMHWCIESYTHILCVATEWSRNSFHFISNWIEKKKIN